jgi:hypothetical protein
MSRQCRGYANSLPVVAPYITGLSTTSSILGATTIVTIFGENFRNYSTVYFGTTLINNVTYFSSSQLSFYVPAVSTYGTYPIQVFNDTLASNIVFFTINNSVGFWNQDPNTGTITNSNSSGGISVSGTLQVNNPIKLNYSPSAITSNTYLGYTITFPLNTKIYASDPMPAIDFSLATLPVDGIWLINYSIIGLYYGGTVGISYGQYGISKTSNVSGILTNANNFISPITPLLSSNNNWGNSSSCIVNTITSGTKTFYIVYSIIVNGSGGSSYNITINGTATRIA